MHLLVYDKVSRLFEYNHSKIIISIAIFAAGYGCFISNYPIPSIIFLFCLIFLIMMFINTKFVVLTILFIRPTLDVLAEKGAFLTEKYVTMNLNAFIGLAVILISIKYIFTKKNLFSFPMAISFVAFFGVSLFSSLVLSPNKILGLADCLRLLSIFCFYILCYMTFKTDDDIKKFVGLIILSSIIPIGFGICQFLIEPHEFLTGLRRINGTFVNPVSFGHFLTIVLLLTLTQYFTKNYKGFMKFLLGILILFLTFHLVITFTRGAWIGLILALLLVGLLKYKKLLLVIPVLVVLAVLFLPVVPARFELLLSSNPTVNSLTTRIMIWTDAIDMFRQSPIFGQGLRAQYILSEKTFGFRVVTHNDYLRLMVETGIIGFLLYLWVVIKMSHVAFTALRRLYNPLYNSVIIGFVSMFFAVLIMSSADSILTSLVLQYPIWGLAGIIHRIYQEKCSETSEG